MRSAPLSYIFLLASIAFALVASAPAASSVQYDVIVVGAGLSGLGAAKKLIEGGKKVLVLEARDRTGGRVHNVDWPDGGYTEVGAEFIGPTQDKVIALANELGLELFEEYNKGSNVFYRRGIRSFYEADSILGAVPPADPVTLLQLLAAQNDLDQMAKKINVQEPWKSDKAKEYDSMTLAQWLDKRLLTDDAQVILNIAIESIFSVDASELSFLYALAYIAAAGNETMPGTFERLTSTPDGAQMYKVNGGTALLPIKLADKLGGDEVIAFNSPVQTIKQDQSYTVTLRNGTSFTSTHVVVAMSPPLAGQIVYDPPLPTARTQLTQSMRMGSIGKAIAKYEKPFWRDSRLSGQALGDTGLARATFDNSDKGATYGALMGFLEAKQMRQYDNATESSIVAQVTKDFVHYFGDQAAKARSWIVQRWDLEEFSQGGPVAVAGVNTLTQYGSALRQRIGNLHFAGTESSDYWVGYMDGALRSGYRVATEIL